MKNNDLKYFEMYVLTQVPSFIARRGRRGKGGGGVLEGGSIFLVAFYNITRLYNARGHLERQMPSSVSGKQLTIKLRILLSCYK